MINTISYHVTCTFQNMLQLFSYLVIKLTANTFYFLYAIYGFTMKARKIINLRVTGNIKNSCHAKAIKALVLNSLYRGGFYEVLPYLFVLTKHSDASVPSLLTTVLKIPFSMRTVPSAWNVTSFQIKNGASSINNILNAFIKITGALADAAM